MTVLYCIAAFWVIGWIGCFLAMKRGTNKVLLFSWLALFWWLALAMGSVSNDRCRSRRWFSRSRGLRRMA